MDRDYIILLYMRISIEDERPRKGEAEESDSITNQRMMLYDFIGNQPELKDCTVIELCDDGYSGTNFERPAMKKLLERVKEKTADCIIVKDLSRFGRDYLTVSDYVEQIFPILGIRFIAVNDGYDSQNYEGTTAGIDIAFRNVIYAWYSKDISEKEKSAKRAKAMRGDYLSPFAPIGYKKDESNKNKLVVDEKSSEIVRYIFKLAGAGIPVAEIAKLLNADKIPTPCQLKWQQGLSHKWWKGICEEKLWDISSITRILRDERYLGKSVYGRKYCPEAGVKKTRKNDRNNWIIVPDCHEPIIGEHEFNLAQNMLKLPVRYSDRSSASALFRGKIRCAVCGYALVREKKKNPSYRCNTRNRTQEFDCMQGSIAIEEIKEAVWQAIQLYCNVLLEKKELSKGQIPVNSERNLRIRISAYQSAFQGLGEQKAIAYERFLDGDLGKDQYMRKKNTITSQQDELRIKMEQLEKELLELSQQKNDTDPAAEEWESCLQAKDLNRKIVEAFVKCIYVYKNKAVRIEWLFGGADTTKEPC